MFFFDTMPLRMLLNLLLVDLRTASTTHTSGWVRKCVGICSQRQVLSGWDWAGPSAGEVAANQKARNGVRIILLGDAENGEEASGDDSD